MNKITEKRNLMSDVSIGSFLMYLNTSSMLDFILSYNASRGGSKYLPTSKMELFGTVFNSWKTLIFFTRYSSLVFSSIVFLSNIFIKTPMKDALSSLLQVVWTLYCLVIVKQIQHKHYFLTMRFLIDLRSGDSNRIS